MGEKDTITKNYMQDKTIFADAFNFLLYDGEQVIKPEQLKPIDTASLVLPYGDDGQILPLQKFRDVLKVATAMEDGNRAYLILGIENQSELHFAMPVKNMLYDAIQYSKQVEDAAKAHRKNKDSPESSGEFLSGFVPDERGKVNMCDAIKGIKEDARNEGSLKTRIETAKNMFANGISDELIITCSGISPEVLRQIKEEKKISVIACDN